MDAPDHIYSVSELNRTVRDLLETGFPEVRVAGEISNCRLQSSGHWYFTLKDAGAQLACALFRGNASRLAAPLADGMHVEAMGSLSLFEARGNYQMIVRSVVAQGAGLLHARFEALKQKLATEGLFDPEQKSALPRFPTRVGLATSPSGAALRDMLNIFNRRAPWISLLLAPCRVQGIGAAQEIAEAVHLLDRASDYGLPSVDLIIVGRGGGSMEDLWEFNDESLARVIAACKTTVVSAVGHEIDFTICDFVADLRAPTPSAAAEIVAPDRVALLRELESMRSDLRRSVLQRIEQDRKQLAGYQTRDLIREPQRRLDEARQRLDLAAARFETAAAAITHHRERLRGLQQRLRAFQPGNAIGELRLRTSAMQDRIRLAIRGALEQVRHRNSRAVDRLRLLGPSAVLERGYSITTKPDGTPVKTVAGLKSGDPLRVKFRDGNANVVVS